MMLATRVVLAARRDLARHHLTDRQSQRIRVVLRQCTHDIALRQYSGKAPARTADQDGTDAVRREQFRRRRKIGRRFDGNNVAAQVTFLGGQNRFDVHGSLPGTHDHF